MKDIYEEWRSYENETILLRPVVSEDAEELLKVYADEKARPLFNCDNFPNPCYFDTLEQMQNEILFYLDSYKWKSFVRWTIVLKEERKIIGTIENFRRQDISEVNRNVFSNAAILRIDLLNDYEKEEVLTDILKLILDTAYKDFHCNIIATKAVKEAKVRRQTLMKMGFMESGEKLIGNCGEMYEDYFIRKKLWRARRR